MRTDGLFRYGPPEVLEVLRPEPEEVLIRLL
jgi:hypothetical protein